MMLISGTAAAIPYETFIDINDQADLEDLLASGDISDDTYEELLDLLGTGVDLNTADRAELYTLPNLTYEDVDKIIAFRTAQNGITDPAALVAAGALTEDKFLAIASFLVVEPTGPNAWALHGTARFYTRWTVTDRVLPPTALRVEVTAQKHFHAGLLAMTTRQRIGEPIYDPNRDALIAEPADYGYRVPKAYARWEDDRFAVIGGSFRAGFAQRLVFDNTGRYTPNGITDDIQLYYYQDLSRSCVESGGELAESPCAGAANDEYITPDFRAREGLLGVAVGAKQIDLSAGWLQLYAWGSTARRSIYQYELVDRGKCADPHDNDDPACDAPTVYVRPDGDRLTPTTQFAYQTLPNVFLEKLVGVNASYFADRRNSIGVTGYLANELNLIDGIELDTQEWARLPTGRTFGAAGANFSFGRGWLDVFGEAAISYDKSPAFGAVAGGGGPAGILRVTASRTKEELELVARYYSPDYANPYARPIAQFDELDGQRARDEMGMRLRYLRADKRLRLRAQADVWVPPSTLRDGENAQPRLDTYARADVRTHHELWLGLWLRYQDKGLFEGDEDTITLCFETSDEETETGETIPCSGRALTTQARARYQPMRALALTLAGQYRLLDDGGLSTTSLRSDISTWAIGNWQVDRNLRLRGRVRYRDEAIEKWGYLEASLFASVDGTVRLRDRDWLRLRADFKQWLDSRASTDDRSPNPELTFWLTYEARL